MSGKKITNDLKIIIVGSSGTGKTSLVNRWTKNEFSETHPTIVSEFSPIVHKYEDNLYRVQLWDIGGQDKSAAVTKIFAKDSHGCIVVCDVNDDKTLEETASWKSFVEDECTFIDGNPIPFLIIRNKIDMIEDDEEKKNLEENTKNFAEENEFINYFLTSAKDNINIQESIDYFLDHILKRIIDYLNQNEGKEDIKVDNLENRQSVRLSKGGAIPQEEQQAKRKCCQ